MKKCILVCLVVLLAMTATVPGAWAGKESSQHRERDGHSIRAKWDMSGTFVALRGYNWGGLAEGATWNYSIHIKEAIDPELSTGSIHFRTGDDIHVIGHVEVTHRNYPYNHSWSGENLAVAGRAEYDGSLFYFIMLYSERAVWFAVSDLPYESYWAAHSAWPPHLRSYQLHSLNTYDFPFSPKVIHSTSGVRRLLARPGW
jgi:hypothetical protein